MAASVTSLRLPDDVREQYETLATVTGRTRNDLMVVALRREAERQLEEIALVQEGQIWNCMAIRPARDGNYLRVGRA